MIFLIIIILMLLGIIPNPCIIDNQLLDSSDTSILFTSKYCSPCKEAKTTIERLQKDNYDVIIVDIHGNQLERKLAIKYHVYTVPTLIIRKNGIEINRKQGVLSEGEYRSLISKKKNPYPPLFAENINPYSNYTGVLIFTSNRSKINFISQRVISRTKENAKHYKEFDMDSFQDKWIGRLYDVKYNPTILYMVNGKIYGRYEGKENLKPLVTN